jgi:hypothetical protein
MLLTQYDNQHALDTPFLWLIETDGPDTFGFRFDMIGRCRYPADRVPLHTRLKSRQVTWRASTHRHMPYGVGPRLPIEVGSGAVTCLAALDPASLFGRALALPRVPQLWILPPCSEGFRR